MTTAEPSEYSLSAIDHHTDYFLNNIYEIYDGLRAKCPVAHSTAHGGFYFAVGYDAVADADRDNVTFSSANGRTVPTPPDSTFRLVPVESDPPEHIHYRRMALPFFSPDVAKRDEPMFRQLATELIDDFIETGKADIVKQLTTPLPAIWILRLLGFDDTKWADWIKWLHALVHERTTDDAITGRDQVIMSIAAEVEKRRTEGLGDDILSHVMGMEIDGEPLEEYVPFAFALTMILGGMDTTSGLTGNSLARMLERPELKQRLLDDPDILPKATEEFLRHDTPAQSQGRLVTQDCEYKGQQLRKGDRLLLVHAAANRDPAVFPNPDVIDFDRKPNRHLAFGVGPHRCMGSHHAKVMFQVMISEILKRLPDFELDGEIEYYPDGGDVYAVSKLPIRFTPGPRSTASKGA